MLRPWVDSTYTDLVARPNVGWRVFRTQMWHWKEFRRWQAHNRRAGRPRSVEEDSRFWLTDRAFNILVWDFRRGSANYTEATKKLLAQHDFSRPFELQEDPEQQDKLTTWTEYLSYECAVYHWHADLVNDQQPDYDKARKVLVDSAVLRPSETEEYICGITSAFQRQSEKELAQKAVKSAEAALAAVQRAGSDPQSSHRSPSAPAQTLATAQSRLDSARDSLDSILRRNKLIKTFKNATHSYREVKQLADRHSNRLRWILEQVPLIEAELQASCAAQGRPHTGRGTKRKLTHDQDDEVTNDPPQKRSGSSRISSLTNDGARSPGPAREPSKHSRRDGTPADERPSKRLRKPNSGDAPKTTPRNQTAARRNTRLRGSATTPTKASTPAQGPTRSKRARGAPGDLPRGTRSSRRLAGDPPEFGMVQERRGALPLYEQPSASSRRGQRAVKGAKPQGIPRSKETRTAGTKKSAKRS